MKDCPGFPFPIVPHIILHTAVHCTTLMVNAEKPTFFCSTAFGLFILNYMNTKQLKGNQNSLFSDFAYVGDGQFLVIGDPVRQRGTEYFMKEVHIRIGQTRRVK